MRTINMTERACVGGGVGGQNAIQLPEGTVDAGFAAHEIMTARPVLPGAAVGGSRGRYLIYKFPHGCTLPMIPREWLR
ncbi:hypothetical protein BTK96_002233 [Burkholderia pyrrocinia]|uniref:hypothetical protein n=1 Tax=Burkholderia sp. IT-111MI5 TaxID=3026439 RepID=UPI002A2F39F2|nr:hypothetical protein [Burkholderia pyrrocinia]EKS9892134.1 hypothetical protein [Burkholderia pyrrocinia]EKS9906495.1 hypothetical protein [Burkholderia pyrrocinia]